MKSNRGITLKLCLAVIVGVLAFGNASAQSKRADADTDKTETTAPVFKGDHTDVDAIREFQKELAVYDLRKQYDFSDPKQVAAYAEKLDELNKADDDDGDAADEDEPKRTRKPKTNQTVRKGDDGVVMVGMSKDESDAAKLGSTMAKWSNRRRGLAN